MQVAPGVQLDDAALRVFCARNGIRRLGLFGSALRDDFRADSDIDLLVEFDPQRTPGLLGIAAMELELAGLLGHEVELRTAADLSARFRDEVTSSARLVYSAS